MIATLVHCHVKPDCVEAFAAAMARNHEGSRQEPGNVAFDVLRQADDPTRFVIYEVFVDEAAMRAHKETAHYLAWREETADLFAETRFGIRYDRLAPADPADLTDPASAAASGADAR